MASNVQKMSRHFVFALAVLCSWNTLLLAATDTKTTRPNLVFIIADDLTFRDIGCYGGQAHTPHIDKLATEGMKFERCFQAAPMCSPTRHNIYTGLYPVKSGAYPNHTNAYPEVRSIVHYLEPLGYRVALSGKTHIGPKTVFPFEYSGKKNPDMAAIEQLMVESAAQGTPFCLFACSNEPHSPWNKGDASRYPVERIKLPPYLADTPVMRDVFSRYLAEITYYDGQVGEILRLLDKHQLSENTLVMVVSEQGNSFPMAKWTCYGHGLQSAMIVRWPDKVAAGTVTDALVEYVDVVPTFVDAAGSVPTGSLEGKSLLPLLTGAVDRHKDYVYGIMTTRGIINGSESYPIRSVRGEKFRLIWNLDSAATFTNAATKADYFKAAERAAESGDRRAAKMVHRYQHRPEFELYDCAIDPLEMKNLADDPQYAHVVKQLKQKLDAWMKDQGDLGIDTEMQAYQRQPGRRNKTRKNRS